MTATACITGPMSDLSGLNAEAFASAESHLAALGYTVINPVRHVRPYRSWMDYLHLGLNDLQRADRVVTLPGVEFSAGSRIILEAAAQLEKPVIPLDLVEQAPVDKAQAA